MTKKKSRAGRKSKVRITKSGKQMKPCPCPIHNGKELPLTEEYFQRARKNWQGYCKQYRNQQYQKWYKKKKETPKIKPKIGAKKQIPNRSQLGIKQPLEVVDIAIGITAMIRPCSSCNKLKTLTKEHWQSNGREGYRQPCKECLKKKPDIK